MAGKKMTRITGHNGLPAWTKDIASTKKRASHLRGSPTSVLTRNGEERSKHTHPWAKQRGGGTHLPAPPTTDNPRSRRTKQTCRTNSAGYRRRAKFYAAPCSSNATLQPTNNNGLLTLLGDILRKGFLISFRPAVIPLRRARHARTEDRGKNEQRGQGRA